jgi:beta-phosphoglucomutase
MLDLPLGVLWDMDGVLLDTMPLHHQAFRSVLAEHAITFTPDEWRATVGMNNTAILQRLLGTVFTSELANHISDVKESRFREVIRGQAQALPGVIEWVQTLHTYGARQAVASSAPSANIELIIDELGLSPYFATLVSGLHLPAKPAPDIFLRAAEALGVPPPRCVVIEDALAGVAGAKSAGMKCVAVTTSFPASALREADIVVERLDQLSPQTLNSLLVSA